LITQGFFDLFWILQVSVSKELISIFISISVDMFFIKFWFLNLHKIGKTCFLLIFEFREVSIKEENLDYYQ